MKKHVPLLIACAGLMLFAQTAGISPVTEVRPESYATGSSTAGIQEAINALLTSGACVHPNYTCTVKLTHNHSYTGISAQINVAAPYIHIEGGGKWNTFLVAASSYSSGPVLFIGNASTGNNCTAGSVGWDYMKGFGVQRATPITSGSVATISVINACVLYMEDVSAWDGAAAFYFNGCGSCVIKDSVGAYTTNSGNQRECYFIDSTNGYGNYSTTFSNDRCTAWGGSSSSLLAHVIGFYDYGASVADVYITNQSGCTGCQVGAEVVSTCTGSPFNFCNGDVALDFPEFDASQTQALIISGLASVPSSASVTVNGGLLDGGGSNGPAVDVEGSAQVTFTGGTQIFNPNSGGIGIKLAGSGCTNNHIGPVKIQQTPIAIYDACAHTTIDGASITANSSYPTTTGIQCVGCTYNQISNINASLANITTYLSFDSASTNNNVGPNDFPFSGITNSGSLNNLAGGPPPTLIDTTATPTVGAWTMEYHQNQNATAATAITYTLPTAAKGLQYCFTNSYNGSAADTGTLEIATSGSGQFIIVAGSPSANGGYVISGGAAGDSACVTGVDSTHWQLYTQSGTWAKH